MENKVLFRPLPNRLCLYISKHRLNFIICIYLLADFLELNPKSTHYVNASVKHCQPRLECWRIVCHVTPALSKIRMIFSILSGICAFRRITRQSSYNELVKSNKFFNCNYKVSKTHADEMHFSDHMCCHMLY